VVSSPFTAVGLAMGEISGTCSFDEANLVVLCTGEDPVPGNHSAITLGSTILAEEDSLTAKMLLHEERHVDQWILGPIFPLWYGQNWLYSQGLSGDQCLNLFEIAAGLEEGGYRC
jgi:hypothetical protein